MLADGELPDDAAAAETDAAPAAAAEPLPAEDPSVDQAAAEVPPDEAPVEEAAAAPAPGVPSDNPETQSLPQQQDEIFLATADAPPPALDALSLPAPMPPPTACPRRRCRRPPSGLSMPSMRTDF